MDQYEAYSFLFSDSLFSNLMLSTNSELAINTMRILGIYDLRIVFIIALLGFIVAIVINYLCGIVGYNLYRFSTDQTLHTRYNKVVEFFEKYGAYLLLLAGIPPFGKFIILLAGFARFGVMKTILITFVSKASYYYYMLYV